MLIQLSVSRIFPSVLARQRKLSSLAFLLGGLFCLCFLVTSSSAQTSQLVPLVTDQTPMGLSSDFGVPVFRANNQNGDYAFLCEGQTAVFFLSQTAPSGSTPARILQYGNEVPGFPGSRITGLGSLQLNDSGLLAFQAVANLSTGQNLSIILSYNGTTFQDLVDSTMLAVSGLAGGGNFLLYAQDQSGVIFNELPETVNLNNGTIFFACDVVGGAANHGEFSWTGGVLRILMNTGQVLPAGANVAMAAASSAGSYIAYTALKAGKPIWWCTTS